MTTPTNDSESAEPKGVFVPLQWKSADELPILFANQLAMTKDAEQFFLIFGRLVAPPVLPNLPVPDMLWIYPVMKFAVPESAMIEIARVIYRVVCRILRLKGIDPSTVFIEEEPQ